MKKIIDRIIKKKLLLAFCGGILFSVPFLVPQLFLFSLLGVALIFISLHSNDCVQRPFFKGLLFGVGFYIPLYYWFVALYPFDAFGFTNAQGIIIIIIACLGISIYHSLFFGLTFFLLGKINVRSSFLPLGLSVAFIFNEWIISQGILGFSWGKTAISQIYALPLLQTSSLFGTYFITFIIVISGAYFGYSIISKDKRRLYSFLGLSIYSANLIVGMTIYFIPNNTENEISASIIQGNVSVDEKWANGGNYSVEYYLKELNNIAIETDSDIILLPESCFPVYMDDDHYIIDEIKRISKENGVTIAFGCIYKGDDGAHNSLYMIDENGNKIGTYSKRHLVPFGEFLPYEDILEKIDFIKNLNLGGFSYIQGDNANVMESNGIMYGSLVCFDSIFSELGRDSVKNGAEIINVITNDSWYKDTRGVYQHAAFSQICAIQNQRYVIRSANTGISMFIDSKGNIINSLPPLVRGNITENVYSISGRTLYSYIGDIFFPIITIVYLVIELVYIIKSKRSNLYA